MRQMEEWLVEDIVRGYQSGGRTWEETVRRTACYMEQGVLSPAGAAVVERRCRPAERASYSAPACRAALFPDHITFAE